MRFQRAADWSPRVRRLDFSKKGPAMRLCFAGILVLKLVSPAALADAQEPHLDRERLASLTVRVKIARQATKLIPLEEFALIWDDRRNQKAGTILSKPAKSDKALRLEIRDGRAIPSVVPMVAGETLEIVSQDEKAHNANISFVQNQARGFAYQFEKPIIDRLVVPLAEPAPIPIQCNIHASEKAWLIVTNHGRVGVADQAGELSISKLPAGKHWFRIWHPHIETRSGRMKVDETERPLDKGRLQLELRPGRNSIALTLIPQANAGR